MFSNVNISQQGVAYLKAAKIYHLTGLQSTDQKVGQKGLLKLPRSDTKYQEKIFFDEKKKQMSKYILSCLKSFFIKKDDCRKFGFSVSRVIEFIFTLRVRITIRGKKVLQLVRSSFVTKSIF